TGLPSVAVSVQPARLRQQRQLSIRTRWVFSPCSRLWSCAQTFVGARAYLVKARRRDATRTRCDAAIMIAVDGRIDPELGRAAGPLVFDHWREIGGVKVFG